MYVFKENCMCQSRKYGRSLIKLSLLPWRKCGRVGVYVHKFTLAVGGVCWSASLLWLLSLGNSYLLIHVTVDSWSLQRKKLDQNKINVNIILDIFRHCAFLNEPKKLENVWNEIIILSKAAKPNLELNGHQNIPRTMLQEWNLLCTTVGKYIKNVGGGGDTNTPERLRFR
jgi:hypothetical protein